MVGTSFTPWIQLRAHEVLKIIQRKILIFFIIVLSFNITQLSVVGNKGDVPSPDDNQISEDTFRTPVILIPGDGGSRIYMRSHDWKGFFCPPIPFWFHIWMNFLFLTPLTGECFENYFALRYNSTTRKTYNQLGIESKIKSWGHTDTIETLDTINYEKSKYFYNLVNFLVEKGYKRGGDVLGAPYDFRKAPNENLDFVPKLKSLIEDTYQKNSKRRVMLLAHSLGNLYTLFFLRKMSPTWIKKHVRGYIAAAPPVGGAVKSLRLVTSGDTLSKYILFTNYVRRVERSMPSLYFLFPSPHFWKPDEVLISTPSRNYTVNDHHQLFADIKYPDGWEMYKDTSHLVDPTWKPDLDELHCIYGHGLNTADRFVWKSDSDFPDENPDTVFGDGDGTINLRSLQVCHSWPNVTVERLRGAKHMLLLSDDRFLEVVSLILFKKDKRDK